MTRERACWSPLILPCWPCGEGLFEARDERLFALFEAPAVSDRPRATLLTRSVSCMVFPFSVFSVLVFGFGFSLSPSWSLS